MIMALLLPFFLLLLSGCINFSSQAESCKHDDHNLRCVQYIKNYDGDTITFNIPKVPPIMGHKMKVRLNGADTPEMKKPEYRNLFPCEEQKAVEAQKAVESILKKAKRIDLKNIKRGKYFRIVADVTADGLSIGDYLIQNKLARPYKGKKKTNINWCKI